MCVNQLHFIIEDDLYGGYIQTHDDALLDELASILYPGIKTPLAPWERIAIFYWVASLKDYFARRYLDFFQLSEATDGDLPSATPASVETSLNAQIRALTKDYDTGALYVRPWSSV